MPTISVENYLKTIYHLEQRHGGRVKTKSIAERLEISLPSVTSMLKSLGQEELVDYRRYKGVRLSERGRQLALKVIRKHRLVELFLVQTLEYSWDEVHAEAERLEHAVSDELAARIERYLAYPRFDPHGDPIPTAEGEVLESRAVPLEQVMPGSRVRVERVLEQDPAVLRYLEQVGMTPGQRAQVTQVLPFDGQMFVQLDGAGQLPLSQELTSRILVVVEDDPGGRQEREPG